MKKGIPLDDLDRSFWLNKINSELIKYSKKSLILACSALKEKYRLKLIKGVEQKVYWFLLNGEFKLIYKRLENRKCISRNISWNIIFHTFLRVLF